MSFIVPFLFCLGIGGTFQLAFRRRFEEALPVGLLFSGLLTYLAGVANRMEWGVWLAVACAAAFPAALIYFFCFRRERFAAALSSFFTPGLLIFALLYAAVFLLDYRRGLGWWDEYSHWAPMAKETFRLNQFYCAPDSALTIHQEYPPFVTLFEYLWCKLSGGYDEPFLYRAYHTLSFSLFLPAARGFTNLGKPGERKGGALACVLLAGCAFVSCAVLPTECAFLTSLLIDPFLGLLLGYCLGTMLLDDSRSFFSLFCLCLGLSALVLTKQIAVCFVALCAALCLLNGLLGQIDTSAPPVRKRSPLPSALLRAFTAACVPAAFYLSWRYVLKGFGQEAASLSASFQLSVIPGILMDAKGELYQRLAAINFKSALFGQGFGTQPFDMTYLQLLVFFTGLFALFAWANRKNRISSRIVLFAVVLLLGGLAYAFALLVTYLFHFVPYEAEQLASYARYLGTYGFALISLSVMLLFRQFALWRAEAPKRSLLRLALVFCALILCVPSSLGGSFQPALVKYSLSREYLSDIAEIEANTEETGGVLVVSQGDKGLAGHILRYELLPRKTESVSLGQPKYGGDVWSLDISVEAFAQMLTDYDYLYVHATDDELETRYQAFFAPNVPIEAGRLYAVNREADGTPVLQPVGESE